MNICKTRAMRAAAFTLVLLAIGTVVSFAEPLVIDEETAVERALSENLTLKSDAIQFQAKQRSARSVWNKFYPTVSATGALSRANTAQDELDMFFMPTGNTLDPWTVSMGVQASLLLNAGMFSAFEAANLDERAAELTYQATEKQIALDVRKTFYNILLLRENIALLEQNLVTAGERREQAQINYQNGLVPELTVLQARAGEENLKPALENVKVAYQGLLMKLKLDMGVPLDQDVELDGSIIVEPGDVLLPEISDVNWSDRTEVQSLMLTIQSLEKNRDAAWLSSTTPSLSLSASYMPMLSYAFDSDTDWFDGESWADRGSMSVTIAVPLDGFLPNSSARNTVAELDEAIAQLEIQREQLIEFSELEARNHYLSLKKAETSIVATRLNVELAQQAYELAEEAFEAGLKDLLDVRTSQDDLNRARVDLINERYAFITALLDLKYVLGLE